jgi:2-polyprenyl-6-methoxyphenol hydroxylase-like FAD-dependent oxidoreductase
MIIRNKTGVEHKSAIIVGAGPVGLYAGIKLCLEGFEIRILEKRTKPHQHSKAIGIHPPMLEEFGAIGLADALLSAGSFITKGVACSGKSIIDVNFGSLPYQFKGILTVPQFKTEAILRSKLDELQSDCIEWDSGVEEISEQKVRTKRVALSADVIIDARGKASWLADGEEKQLEPYPDYYIMGDFDSGEIPRTEAHIWLHKNGLIESFPLNEKKRRWVVKVDAETSPDPTKIKNKVKNRTGIELDVKSCVMNSSFTPEWGIRKVIRKDNVIRLGDSAHIISPIGGQGMNLGWLDVEDVLNYLKNPSEKTEKAVEIAIKSRFLKAKKRSEFNMMMGRAAGPVMRTGKKILLRLMGIPLLKDHFARQFTMDGLK